MPAAEGMDPQHFAQTTGIAAFSPYLGSVLRRYPEGDAPGEYRKARLHAGHLHQIHQQILASPDENGLRRLLRQLRHRGLLHIAWRDLAGWATLDETLEDTSALADTLVGAALQWLYEAQVKRLGQPIGPDGQPIRLVVFGLGKLGGRELNLSSDIDLVFAYEHEGELSSGLSHAEFFATLGRKLSQVLNDPTEDGFVYRVDTLLRPFGSVGPLAVSAAGLEHYCQTHGREWERYAWIKARPIAGDIAAGERMLETLQPFIYRRYLDYGVFESLRDMKQRIEEDASRRGLENDLKLGNGGIREIEFIAQSFQLVRGGQQRELRSRSLRATLATLGRLSLLPEADVEILDAAYVFLRRAENRIQIRDDQQLHGLPRDPAQLFALAQAMGFVDTSAFLSALERARQQVKALFERTFVVPQAQARTGDDAQAEAIAALWQDALGETNALKVLGELGFHDTGAALAVLADLRHRSGLRAAGDSGRRRLRQLMPPLLRAVGRCPEPDVLLPRLAAILQAIAGRTAYLALLLENPAAISQLVRLCSASAWIAERLARYPAALDQLLDPRILYAPPRKMELQAELAAQAEGIALDDVEQQMELLRRFKHAQTLRVAAADVSDAVPLMVVSDHLTEIAEVLLQHALRVAEAQMQSRHGRPRVSSGAVAGLCILGYGKLGGLELGYGSDLDLVFLHDGDDQALTDGAKPLEQGVYFARLVQKLVHLLATATGAGVAYEIDVSLRPNGQSGLPVSSWSAFEDYQRNKAWTWEHQALLRARPIAGKAELADVFTTLRRAVLSRPRDPVQLRQEVLDMRARMRSHRDVAAADTFDIKQGEGGITDIEFMVQYALLRWAADYPQILEFTDNIRGIDGLARVNPLFAEHGEALKDAYRQLRWRVHRQVLQNNPAVVSNVGLETLRNRVIQFWQRLFEKS